MSTQGDDPFSSSAFPSPYTPDGGPDDLSPAGVRYKRDDPVFAPERSTTRQREEQDGTLEDHEDPYRDSEQMEITMTTLEENQRTRVQRHQQYPLSSKPDIERVDASRFGGSSSNSRQQSPRAPTPHKAPTAVSQNQLPCLAVPGVKSVLYASCISLASVNIVIGFESMSSTCSYLPSYALLVGLLCAMAVISTHWASERMQAEQSALVAAAQGNPLPPQASSVPERVLRALFSLFLALLVVYSLLSIGWLSSGECLDRRGLRQLVIADQMIILATAASVGIYILLKYNLPDLRFSAFHKHTGRTLALFLCLMSITASIVNVATHGPEGLEAYHWGFETRAHLCPKSCEDQATMTHERFSTSRRVVCYDTEGEEVDKSLCQNFAVDAEPDSAHIAVACPLFDCGHPGSTNPPRDAALPPPFHWAVQREWLITSSGQADEVDPTKVSLNQKCTREEGWTKIRVDLGCYSQHAEVFVSESECAHLPFPRSDMQGPSDDATELPQHQCRIPCTQLWASAILYIIVASAAAVLLAVSILARRKRSTDTDAPASAHPSSCTRQSDLELDMAEERGERAEFAAQEAFDVTSDETVAAAMSPTTVEQEEREDSEHTELHMCVRATKKLARSLWNLSMHGSRSVRPWWRHLILVFISVLVLFLSMLSFFNMVSLSSSTCRDFLVSSVVNAIGTFALAVIGGNILIAQRRVIVQQERNPLEVVGLLQMEEDDEALEDVQFTHESPQTDAEISPL
jgi:hypothetical protein